MSVRYYDRGANAIDQPTWQRLSNRPGYCHVAFDDITLDGLQLVIVTYWLGLILDPHQHPPLIYRTVAGAHRLPCGAPDATGIRVRIWAWPTGEAARTGHTDVVAWLTGTGPPPSAPLR